MAAQQLSQSIGSLSEEEEEGESQEDEETSSQEDIDEDNISTCASQLESDSDEESSEDEKEDSIDESLDIDTSLPPSLLPASRQVVKGDQTPQASTTPQDEKKELFSSGSDEKEPKEKGKESKKSKDKEVEATSTPGTDSTLAFREWLAQAHDSVRTGHGLEWAASNLPGRRALQLLPRPNMAMNMHMPAVPVFHLALPATRDSPTSPGPPHHLHLPKERTRIRPKRVKIRRSVPHPILTLTEPLLLQVVKLGLRMRLGECSTSASLSSRKVHFG